MFDYVADYSLDLSGALYLGVRVQPPLIGHTGCIILFSVECLSLTYNGEKD